MSQTTVRPTPTDAILCNPGMGVLLLLRGVNKPRYDDVPPDAWFLRERIADKILVDVPWSVLEPREGDYQWGHPEWEGCFETWVRAGFRVALQVRGMGSLGTFYDDGVPQWVFDAGAAYIDEDPEGYRGFGTRRPVDDRPLRAPVYWDPVYVEKSCQLAAALGRRYADRPEIEFIMPGHMGKWGEMHVSLGCAPVEPWVAAGLTAERYLAAHQTVLTAYRAAFPRTRLVQELGAPLFGRVGAELNVDFYGIREILDFLVEHDIGVKQNGFRDTWVTTDNFATRAFHICYPRVPVLHECWGMFCTAADAEAVQHFHGSYWNRGGEAQGLAELHILGDTLPIPRGGAHTEAVHTLMAETTVAQRQEIWRIAARRIGYRFALDEATFPDTLAAGVPFTTRLQWTNRGAAPCYANHHVYLALLNDAGRPVWEAHQSPEIMISSLLRDAGRTVTEALRWTVPTGVAPGAYQLAVGMCVRDDAQQRLALPIDGDDGARRYVLETVRVE